MQKIDINQNTMANNKNIQTILEQPTNQSESIQSTKSAELLASSNSKVAIPECEQVCQLIRRIISIETRL